MRIAPGNQRSQPLILWGMSDSAATEALGPCRLLTNDEPQAIAARALGFGVLLPR